MHVTDRTAVGLPWLTRLRWGAAAGQLAAVAVVHQFAEPMPLARVLSIIAAGAASNLALAVWLARGHVATRPLCGAVLALDTVLLTGLLQATGGPLNPFSILYLVHITLAAVVLGAAWTWALAGLAVACYGALFLAVPFPAIAPMHAHDGGMLSLHLQGMWIAFMLAAALTAYFVVQLSAAIEGRDAELARVREQASRAERLASLTTLAAGAAHELGTPLATIAVVATELERAVATLPESRAIALGDDARLIRSEVSRCRRILDLLASDAGGPAGEAPTMVDLRSLIDDTLSALPPGNVSRVAVSLPRPVLRLNVPRRALVQVLANLVHNALDASTPDGAVRVAVDLGPATLEFAIEDDGPGMPPDVLARCGEPFFTTKGPGRGLGLGVFLARTLAEELGGSLDLSSPPGRGVRAALRLPTAVLVHGKRAA
ncbi:MAG TPA: ATP-binding protein [Candidatus Eisenbacteria bacterium]|nr:ATP-binding protein [Candidatus Eisenbacteria bacterium]